MTRLYDLDPEMLTLASSNIEKELGREVEKAIITEEEKQKITGRLTYTANSSDCVASLIIEAIVERSSLKSDLFNDLASFNGKETIFATNTSSLSVTQIAEQTGFPERVIGVHFFNPANRMKLVEIVRTKYISNETLGLLQEFTKQINKTAVICDDQPGFIVNHVARPFYLEAMRIAKEGISDIGTIDRIMESAGFRMGPFHLMDLIGNDINFTVSCSVYESLGRPPRLKPSALQEELVKKGMLGQKTGQGFFEYDRSKK
jgi:3-hydroxybutyryl-CoA dehydrogenase